MRDDSRLYQEALAKLRDNHRSEFKQIYQELKSLEGVELQHKGRKYTRLEAMEKVYKYIIHYHQTYKVYPSIGIIAGALDVGTSERVRKCILALVERGILVPTAKSTTKGVGSYRLEYDTEA